MKIAIIVQGRLYGFDLARALVDRGHTVRVFTNYPKWATRRFGLSDDTVRGFWIHGILTRMADKAGVDFTPFLHRLFGRWAASQVAKERWDVIHAFSGVAEEALSLEPAPPCAALSPGDRRIFARRTVCWPKSRRVAAPRLSGPCLG